MNSKTKNMVSYDFMFTLNDKKKKIQFSFLFTEICKHTFVLPVRGVTPKCEETEEMCSS